MAGERNLPPSTNEYDWLGHGIYFWENNHQRALEYANLLKANPERSPRKVTEPAVLGAAINLGHCLNLLDSKFLQHVKSAYELVRTAAKETGKPLPENKNVGDNQDLLLRSLDCAVINTAVLRRKELVKKGQADYEFDTVRAAFIEGNPIYESAGFRDKTHIQVCVRNHNCIKGYFRVLQPDENFRIP